MTFVPLTMGGLTPRRVRYREEFLAALAERPPRLVLIDTFTTGQQIGIRGQLPSRFAEFLDTLRRGFDSTGTVGKYTTWSRTTPPPAASAGHAACPAG